MIYGGSFDSDVSNLDQTNQIQRFRKNAKELIEYICEYNKNINEEPIYPDVEPGYLRPLFPDEAPINPQSFRKILNDFDKNVMPGTLHWLHPMFYAYFNGGNSFPNIYAEILMTACGGNNLSWQAQPSATELETLMLDWLGRALHLPLEFLFSESLGRGGGCTQPSASDATFAAFISARYKILKSLGCFATSNSVSLKHSMHPSVCLPKLICYSSAEAHSSVEKAANLALVEIRVLNTDHFRVTGDILENAVREDKESGRIPFLFVGNAGSTGVGAIDDLESCGLICKKYDLWFHVDGAYGLAASILPEMQYLMKGLEYADSFMINPCKLLLASIDCACLYLRDIEQFKQTWIIDSENIRSNETQISSDCQHFGLSTSRRMRSLKLFFLFKYYGINELQNYVRKIIRLTKYFESLVRSDNRFQVTSGSKLGVFCFRQKGSTDSQLNFNALLSDYSAAYTDRLNMNLLYRINKSRKIHMCPCVFKNKYNLRISVNREFADEKDIEYAWKIIQSFYVENLDDDWQMDKHETKSNSKLRRMRSSLSFIDIVPDEGRERRASKLSLTFGPMQVIDEKSEPNNLVRS